MHQAVNFSGDALGSRSAVALPEKFCRSWVEALPYRLKIIGHNLPFEPKQFSSASVPLGLQPSDSDQNSHSVEDGVARSPRRWSWHESSAPAKAIFVRNRRSNCPLKLQASVPGIEPDPQRYR